MPDIPLAIVTHMVRGRLRVKIPSRRRDNAFFDHVAKVFSQYHPTIKVETNPSTASTLFTGQLSPSELFKFFTEHQLFRIEKMVQRHKTLISTVKESFRDMDRKLRRSTGGELDIASLIFVALVGHGIYQIARGNFTAPAWYTAFWYALGVFSKSSLVDMPVVDPGDE